MPLIRTPRTLKGQLQILFIAMGTAFLALATILLYLNGQAGLRRQILGTATTAGATASSLIRVEEHCLIQTPADMNTESFRMIMGDLGALRRANPSIYHIFTLGPVGDRGSTGVVVDMGNSAPGLSDAELRRGRLPIGSPAPSTVPVELIRRGMSETVGEILDLSHADQARVIAVSPLRTVEGASLGVVVVEMSASSLVSEAKLLWYVSMGIFLVGLIASVVASTFVSRWVTRPIEDLLRAVEGISRGNLSTRVKSDTRNNELGALAGAFNLMAQSLEASQSRSNAQQGRLRELHRLGSDAASSLELPPMLEVAANGLRGICGGTEAIAGASVRRESSIEMWARSGDGEVDTSTWEVSLDRLSGVLGGETRYISRPELEAAGLGDVYKAKPGEYALAAPLRVSEETLGILLAFGDREHFHDDAISVASLFAAQISAAVGNARLFEQVKALDRSKSEFLSIASHEVRTPLTVMKSSLDVLMNSMHVDYSDDQRQLIAFCQESVERLIGLVRDILDVSKIEAGVLSIQFTPTSLNSLVEKCLMWVPQLPGGQGVEVEARLPAAPAMVFADPNRIIQVLENLMSNAIKFSTAGGKVTIELREHERNYEVVVTDQGKGIAADDLDRIFGKFFQVAESATREQGGTGLGLAICKGIIEAHKGRIWAESELGRGSRFHFMLARVLDTPTGDHSDAQISVASLLSSVRPDSQSPARAER